MKLSNSLKLLVANFSLFWKVFAYKALAFGVAILLIMPVMSVINKCLTLAGFYDIINQFLSMSFVQGIGVIFETIFAGINSLFTSISILASTNVLALIYLIIIISFVIPFVFKLSDIPASETTYSYMSSLNKNSFMVNFLDEFGKSAGYSALKTLLEIPLWFILFAGIYGILSISVNNLTFSIISPVIMAFLIVAFISFKTTILSGWAPSVIAFNLCAGRSFKKGIKAVSRKFLSTLSSFAVIVTVMLAVVYVFGVYALIVVIPLASVIITVFGQVLFFESQGMNYYTSPDNIVMPRKLEQADNIKKVRNII